MSYTYALTQDVQWQTQATWQTPDTPFMDFAFWQALGDTGAIGEKAGWLPLYILIVAGDTKPDTDTETNTNTNNNTDNTQTLQAVMPLFIKGHHQGEYVFDHAWAEAYARYGADYYPRLVTCVPYTPVRGHRLWLSEGVSLSAEIWQTALQAVDGVAKQIGASSWHGLFVNQALATLALTSQTADSLLLVEPELDPVLTPDALPLLERQGSQFLWHNQNLSDIDNDGNPKPFHSFEEFLSTLTAKKRKNIRAERKKIAKQHLSCQLKLGDSISDTDWEVFYQCYAATYLVRGRNPYLTLEFFRQIGQTMASNLMLAQGLEASGAVIACSLFFYDRPSTTDLDQQSATLYGRYWGALAEYDSLHFELCYYQGIEFAIAQGLAYFDPGTQGEHKLIRGFVPIKTHSLHRIYDPRFVPAIRDFCEQDRLHMQQYRQQAHDSLPFNMDNMPKFKG